MEIAALLEEKRVRIRLTVISVLMISFFYVAFRPFHMAHYGMNDFIFVNSAYAVISLVVLSFYLIVLPIYARNRFFQLIATPKRRLSLLLVIVFNLGLAFFLFKISFGYYDLSLERIATGLMAVFAMAIFPIILLKVVDKEKEKVDEIENHKVLISEKNGEIVTENLLYIYSDKNYVVWVCSFDQKIEEIRVRETLKSVISRLENTKEIVQTHRAFLVNRSKVKDIKRSDNSYRIILKDLSKEVPLSRNFRSQF